MHDIALKLRKLVDAKVAKNRGPMECQIRPSATSSRDTTGPTLRQSPA